MTSAAYRRNAPAAKEHFPFAAVFLCPARLTVPCTVYYALCGLFCPVRFIVPCAVYCALRGILPCAAYCALRGLLCLARLTVPCTIYYALCGLLCPARFIMLFAVCCALRGLLCRNVHICRGAPHYFYDRQNFLCAARLFVRREVTPRGFCTGGRAGLSV